MEHPNCVSTLIVLDGVSLVDCPCGLHMRNRRRIRFGICGSIRNTGPIRRRAEGGERCYMLLIISEGNPECSEMTGYSICLNLQRRIAIVIGIDCNTVLAVYVLRILALLEFTS